TPSRHASNQILPRKQVQHNGRRAVNNRESSQKPEINTALIAKRTVETHRNREGRWRTQDNQRNEKIAPGSQKRKQAGDGNARPHQWKYYSHQTVKPVTAIQPCRLLQLDRDAIDKSLHDPQ